MWSYNLVSLPETQKQTFEQWRQFMRHKSPEILAFIRCCRSITWSEITIWSGSDFWSQSVIRLFELSCNRCQVIGWWWETGITPQEFLPSCIACLTFLKQQDVRVLSHHVLGDFKSGKRTESCTLEFFWPVFYSLWCTIFPFIMGRGQGSEPGT